MSITINTLFKGLANNCIKIGEIRLFCGENVPSKWKLCNGGLLNRTTYAKLFNLIGTTWGGGDGSTTFALPNMAGRVIISSGDSSTTGSTSHVIGTMDGEEKHTIIAAELASHNHYTAKGGAYWGYGGNSHHEACAMVYYPQDGWNSNYTGSTGSNTAHNTMQPYLVANYIIYTGVDTP